jgi:hypothetical protein
MSNERLRIGRWTRLGIVLSIVWFMGAFSHVRSDIRASYLNTIAQAEHDCMEDNAKRPRSAAVDCFERRRETFYDEPAQNWWGAVLLASAPMPVAWLAIWLTVTSVRRMARGIRHQSVT